MREQVRERGAAAVEFALVVPILIALILGIAVFGRAYQVQSSLSMAAREGARDLAIASVYASPEDVAKIKTDTETYASAVGASGATAKPTECTDAAESATMTVEYHFDFLGVELDLTGTGVMQCGG